MNRTNILQGPATEGERESNTNRIRADSTTFPVDFVAEGDEDEEGVRDGALHAAFMDDHGWAVTPEVLKLARAAVRDEIKNDPEMWYKQPDLEIVVMIPSNAVPVDGSYVTAQVYYNEDPTYTKKPEADMCKMPIPGLALKWVGF